MKVVQYMESSSVLDLTAAEPRAHTTMRRNKSISNWMTSALGKAPPTSSNPPAPPPPSTHPPSKGRKAMTRKMKQPSLPSRSDGRHAHKEPSPLAAGTLPDSSDIPWSVKHQPQSLADLAVHKKKVAEVQQWLEFALSPHSRHPMLLLLGPPGCGKTATMQVLSREMGFSLLEWSNPVSDVGGSEAELRPGDLMVFPESQTKQFRSFLLRANRYPSLQVGVVSGCGKPVEKKVVLVEEFPNAFLRDPSKFHEVMNSLSPSLHYPLVFIVSESHRRESSAHALFSRATHNTMDVHTINFNPVAHTTLVKTLQKIASIECNMGTSKKPPKGATKFYVPSREVIESLAESSVGDIRSAVNALQFTCLKDSTDISSDTSGVRGKTRPRLKRERSGSTSGPAPPKLRRHGSSSSSSSNAPLAAIGGRDNSLFLFRALGKILYCKRETLATEEGRAEESGGGPPSLPTHLQHCRRNPLLVDPESVIEHTHLTSDMFILYLHQNYVQFLSGVEDIVCGTEYLSDSDIIGGTWSDSKESYALLQSCSASVACRGLMYAHTTHHTAVGGNRWRPLHKPQWTAVSRKYQENCHSARELFLHLGTSLHAHLWTPVELQTEIIPHLALVNVPLRNPDQAALLQSVSHFSSQYNRFQMETLGEKDIESVPTPDACAMSVHEYTDSGPSPCQPSVGTLVPFQEEQSTFHTCSQNTGMGPSDSHDEIIEDFEDDIIW